MNSKRNDLAGDGITIGMYADYIAELVGRKLEKDVPKNPPTPYRIGESWYLVCELNGEGNGREVFGVDGTFFDTRLKYDPDDEFLQYVPNVRSMRDPFKGLGDAVLVFVPESNKALREHLRERLKTKYLVEVALGENKCQVSLYNGEEVAERKQYRFEDSGLVEI